MIAFDAALLGLGDNALSFVLRAKGNRRAKAQSVIKAAGGPNCRRTG